jgi:hypothetical protein
MIDGTALAFDRAAVEAGAELTLGVGPPEAPVVEEDAEEVDGDEPDPVVGLLPLENILTCLDEVHRVEGTAVEKDLVVQMRTGNAPR